MYHHTIVSSAALDFPTRVMHSILIRNFKHVAIDYMYYIITKTILIYTNLHIGSWVLFSETMKVFENVCSLLLIYLNR